MLSLQMSTFLRNRLWPALTLVLAVPLLCLAAKEFSMPKTQPAFSYPAHDYHAKTSLSARPVRRSGEGENLHH